MQLLTEQMLSACGLDRQARVLCAFSGGPDSLALLLEMKRAEEAGWIGPVWAAHFEHGIRGAQSRADLDFCRRICLRLGVPLFSESGDAPAFGKKKGLSLETAARELRYDFLRRTAGVLGAQAIALGHHRDDQAETVLLHLLRGSGMKGLTGMAPRKGDLVRPLLFVGRADILAYLLERRQAYCLDDTNLFPQCGRNRLRLEAMPILEQVHPGAAANIAACAQRLRAEDAYLDALAREAMEESDGSRRALSQLPEVLRKRAAMAMLRKMTEDFTQADVDRLAGLFAQPSGRTVTIRGGLVARADGDRIRLLWAEEEGFSPQPLPLFGAVDTPFGRYAAQPVEAAKIPCPPWEGYLDMDRLQFPLIIRRAERGERFCPLGLGGSKLLSDYFTDRKMGRGARQRPILADGAGPVFIPGGTVDERVKITENTKRILHIKFEKGDKNHG